MSYFFVVDAKCKVLPKSSLPQDGSDFYFCRCVVPAASKEQAIADLTDTLRQDHTFIEEVFKVLLYKDAPWKEDDFEVHESFEESKNSHKIALGCFVSEKSLSKKIKYQ